MPVVSPEHGNPPLVDISATFLPPAPMRQIDRVTGLSDATIAGEVDVGPDHWVYRCHFPEDPIFPGTLIIEAAGQLAALWAWTRGHRGRPRLVRTHAEFHHPVGPSSTRLELRARVRCRQNVTLADVDVRTGDVRVATVKAVLVVLPGD